MKIPPPSIRSARRRRREGSAVFVVFVLVSIMTTYVIANSLALHYLKRELRLIEKTQRKAAEPVRMPPPAKSRTNAVERTGGAAP